MINHYVIFRNVDGFLNSLPILAQHFPWSLVLLLIASPFSTCSTPTHDNPHGRVWRRHGRRRRGHWMRPRRRRRRRHWQRLRRAQQPRCSAAGRGEGCHLNGFNQLWPLCQHTNRLYLSQTWTKSSWNNTSIEDLKIHQDSISTLGQFSFWGRSSVGTMFHHALGVPNSWRQRHTATHRQQGCRGRRHLGDKARNTCKAGSYFYLSIHPSTCMYDVLYMFCLSDYLSIFVCIYIYN